VGTPPAPLVAALSDRYRLERELGQGGMATVYLAHDLKHDREVAIKVLRPELAAVLGPTRFLAEIKITAGLDHPHILTLIDSGAAAGFLYYVLPLVRGESLRDKLDRQKQLGLDEALTITEQVAGALDYAHRHKVIHRDIKPENILLQEGEAMLTDFGIALAVQEAGGARLTDTGIAVGTPSYMSPEQSMAERDIDGRTDIYALGCVLYEMLAGEPPYTGPTNQAIIAKRINHPVPSVRALRETVPESVDRALMSALAKSPADRFATAAEFAAALEAGRAGGREGGKIMRSPALPIFRLAALLAALALTGIIGWIWWHRSHPPTALDSNLLAIAPFEVHDSTLHLWHEGLVDVLARNLDGAGPLRTVPTSVVLHRWRGPADRATAATLGKATGAGLVAFGDVALRGRDSVTLRLTLLDVAKNAIDGDVEVSGPTDRINDLADSLGRRMLGALGRERPIAAVRQGPLGATSLPALKAFLQGEQWYRRGEWDSALVYYDEAISDDSTFSLALGRMGLVLGWTPPTQSKYKAGEEYWRQAVRYRAGQSTRDSLIMAADLLHDPADTSTNVADFVEFHRRSLATVQEAVRQYPADPEVWYKLGEAYYHLPNGAGGDYVQSLAAFDRAIALDPEFGPAYQHILDLALRTGQPDRALQYARAAASLAGNDEKSSAVRLASRLLLLPVGEGEAGIARQLDSAGPLSLFRTGLEFLLWWPDSNETAVWVLRRLASLRARQGESVPWVDDSLMRIQYVAFALMLHGHLRDAAEVDHRLIVDPAASPFSGFADPLLELALFGTVSDDIAAKAFSPSLAPGVAVSWDIGPPRSLKGLPWWAMKRDTSALVLFGRRMGEAARRERRPVDHLRAQYLEAAAAGYVALVQGDSATALSRFTALSDTACALVPCFHQKITEAALLAARGEDARAAEILDTWLVREGRVPIAVVARLDRARIAERLHDRETAIRHYQFVLDIWRRADPELAHYLAEARQGLARLTAEPQ